jgi:membrane associated rhomboid family serine protease
MLLPLKDINPTEHRPIVTYGLIAANVAVFIYQLVLGPTRNTDFVLGYGVVPFEITHLTDLVGKLPVGLPIAHVPGPHPIWLTLFTSMFMHGGLWHLIGNMLFLWIFGNNIEDILGPVKFIVFYVACGLAAAAAHIASDPSSTVPTIGASGAIFGVVGAYLIAFPRAQVLTLLFLGFFVRLVALPAFVIIIYYFVIQAIFGLASLGASRAEGIAWFAHIGGFIAGIALIYAMAGRRISWLRHGGYADS